METAFDPKRYLTRVGGGDYLEVKWRIFWFRLENPNGNIATELVEHHLASPDGEIPGMAVFKATIAKGASGSADGLDFDQGSATGWGSETEDDFRDYLEKAETKAVGRALAALGYGAQFAAGDFDEGSAPVDAPVRQLRSPIPQNTSALKLKRGNPASEKQWADLGAWRDAQKITIEQMETIIRNVTGVENAAGINTDEAGKVLYSLNRHSLDDLLAGAID